VQRRPSEEKVKNIFRLQLKSVLL